MNKPVIFLSFIGITILFVLGLLAPANPGVWLASTSHWFAFVRLILMAGFGALLVSSPPRSLILRQGLGLLAVIVAIWAIGYTYANEMKFLDTLSLIEFSVCAGVTVLEKTGEQFLQNTFPSTKKVPRKAHRTLAAA